jgi:hypothetical protein
MLAQCGTIPHRLDASHFVGVPNIVAIAPIQFAFSLGPFDPLRPFLLQHFQGRCKRDDTLLLCSFTCMTSAANVALEAEISFCGPRSPPGSLRRSFAAEE